MASLWEINGDVRYQSRKHTKVQPAISLHARYKHKGNDGCEHIIHIFCSEIHHLESYTVCPVSHSVQSKDFALNWHAWTYGNEFYLNIYCTRKWRGKRLEAVFTIFTSLPPLFSFHSSRKRLSCVMISSRVSIDLLQDRTALGWIQNIFMWENLEKRELFALVSSCSWIVHMDSPISTALEKDQVASIIILLWGEKMF